MGDKQAQLFILLLLLLSSSGGGGGGEHHQPIHHPAPGRSTSAASARGSLRPGPDTLSPAREPAARPRRPAAAAAAAVRAPVAPESRARGTEAEESGDEGGVGGGGGGGGRRGGAGVEGHGRGGGGRRAELYGGRPGPPPRRTSLPAAPGKVRAPHLPRGGGGRRREGRRGARGGARRADYLTCRCGEFISLCLRNGVCCGPHCLGKKPGCKVSETKLE